MRDRITARVLLLDPDDRLLLMKGRLPNRPESPGAWFTVGGGAAPGESVREAAAREVLEETGFTAVELGAIVWYRETVLQLAPGESTLFKESYFVARCPGGELSRAGWEDHEHDLIDDIRWWSLKDLRVLDEPVFPQDLIRLLPDVLAGRIFDPPLRIAG